MNTLSATAAAAAFSAWAPAVSPWSPWAKPVLFAQAMHWPVPVAPAPPPPLSGEWFREWSAATAWIIDLPGEESLTLACQLAHHGFVPVPLFNTTLGPSAVVDAEGVAARLVDWAAALAGRPVHGHSPPVFVLDSWRRRGQRSLTPGHFDNRWVVFPQDFPSATMLRDHGIGRVLLWQERLEQPAEDLAHVLLRWQEAGIGIWAKAAPPDALAVRLQVVPPPWFRSLFERIAVATGLRRNSAGGFGGVIPMPSSGRHGFG